MTLFLLVHLYVPVLSSPGTHSNSSPGTGRHPLHSPKETFDSGISEGSTECLDRDPESSAQTSNENSMERNKRASAEQVDYENIGNVQRLSAVSLCFVMLRKLMWLDSL